MVAVGPGAVRAWLPSRSGASSASGSGYAVTESPPGWGAADGAPHTSLTASLRVTLTRQPPADYDSGWFNVRDGSAFQELAPGLGAVGRIRVVTRADDGPNAGFHFPSVGSAQANGGTGHAFGGVLGAFTDSTIRVWAASGAHGRPVHVADGWGGHW